MKVFTSLVETVLNMNKLDFFLEIIFMNLQLFFQVQLILEYSQMLVETEITKITKNKKKNLPIDDSCESVPLVFWLRIFLDDSYVTCTTLKVNPNCCLQFEN